VDTTANAQLESAGWFQATIGHKQLIAVSGLGLAGFVLTHMAGNLLILVSAQAYNEYSHALISNPFIYVAEAGLVLLFLMHLTIATRVSWNNLKARGSRYAHRSHGDKGTSMIQRTLWPQGLLIAVFLGLHLNTFKYGTIYMVNYGHGEIRDLHKLALEVFHQPGYVAWYIVCLIALLFHLSHGVRSSLQSFGIHHPRYVAGIKAASWAYALIVGLGFIIQPLYVYFIHQG